MSESATLRDARRSATARRITSCARQLTEEHGLDGFTMDDLAKASDVSRRTLFNYFPGKLDAVLGPPPEPPADALTVFRRGGPHGNLVLDLRELADEILEAERVGRQELAQLRCLLLANPKLLSATHDRFLRLSEVLVDEIEHREGPAFGRRRAQVAIGVLATLFSTSLDAFLTDPRRRTLTHHFNDTLGIARELFG